MIRMKKNDFIVFLYALCIIPFLGIFGIKNLVGANIYSLFQVFSFCTSLIILFIYLEKNRIKINLYLILLLCYELLSILVTIAYHRFSFGVFIVCANGVVLSGLIISDPKKMLKAITIVSILIAIINFLSIVKYGVDEYSQYFIGGKNSFTAFLIPTLIYGLINMCNNKLKYFILILLLMITIVPIILTSSGTGIIVSFFCIILLFFKKIIQNKWELILIIFTINFFLLLFNNLLFDNEVWINITSLLGKSSTLTDRNVIWRLAENYFFEHPFFGIGRGYELIYINKLGKYNVVMESHNMILEILVSTGFLGILLFMSCFFLSVKRINLQKKSEKYIYILIILFFINGLTESIGNNYLFLFTMAFANAKLGEIYG